MKGSANTSHQFTLYASLLALGALGSQFVWMRHVWDSLALREVTASGPEPEHLDGLNNAIGFVQEGLVYSTAGFVFALLGLACWSVAQWRREPGGRNIPLMLLLAYLAVLAVRL